MARTKIPTINWRSELGKLDSYFQDLGGVIHINTSEDSPSSYFVKAICSRMENDEFDREIITIVIDGENSATRYLKDILDEIESILEIEVVNDTYNPIVNIGNNINSGGDVIIEDVSVVQNFGQPNPRTRAKRIIKTIEDMLPKIRVAIILNNVESSDPNELLSFKSTLWDNGLSELVEDGMLLIGLIQENCQFLDKLPEPDLVFDLPSKYDNESKRNAKEDIAQHIYKLPLLKHSIEEASHIANGIVIGNSRPKELHAKFAGIIQELADQNE